MQCDANAECHNTTTGLSARGHVPVPEPGAVRQVTLTKSASTRQASAVKRLADGMGPYVTTTRPVVVAIEPSSVPLIFTRWSPLVLAWYGAAMAVMLGAE
jgi:hypothetical protein